MNLRLSRADREILALAIPALGALAIDPLLTMVDTAFVARLGTIDLAALGVDTAILGFAFFAFNFLAYVTTPLVARSLGGGDVERARSWVGDALVLAIGIGVVVTIALEITAPLIVDLMGATPEVAERAVAYLRIRALAAVGVLVVTVGHGAFRGYKDTRTPLLVAVVVNGLNMVLDPILIFGMGLGLEGAAWATVIAQYIGAVWFLILISRRSMASRPVLDASLFSSLATLGRNGALLTARTGLLLAALTVAASTATRIGPSHIAAHQLAVQLFLLAAMLADSFAIAAQAMVAEAAGRGDRVRLHALNRRLMVWGLVAGGVLTIALGIGRFGLAYLASEDRVADLAVSAGGVVALMEPLAALVFVADGVFLGLLALGTMVMSTGAGAGVAVVLMLFTPMGESLTGIWLAVAVMMLIRGLVFVVSYRRSVEMAVRS